MSELESASNVIHHAHLLLGAPEEAEIYLKLFCKDLGVRISNNPDFFAFRVDTFGIDEARELRILSTRGAVVPRLCLGQAGIKIFFIVPARLTLEAQNALLKTFEEPFPNTYFLLVVREEALVTAALLSRMQTVRLSKNLNSDQTETEKFLLLSLKDRLLFAKKFADEGQSLSIFLDNLLLLLRKRPPSARAIEYVYHVRRFAHDFAALPRLMLEHLSLVL